MELKERVLRKEVGHVRHGTAHVSKTDLTDAEQRAHRDERFIQLAEYKSNRFADTLAQPILSVVRDAWYTGLRKDVVKEEDDLELALAPWSVGNFYR
jgi:hypothetical protein